MAGDKITQDKIKAPNTDLDLFLNEVIFLSPLNMEIIFNMLYYC